MIDRPIWVRAGLGIAAVSEIVGVLGCQPKPKDIPSVIPTPIVVPTVTASATPAESTALSERRISGLLLENLSQAKATDFDLDFRHSVSLDNLTMTSVSRGYKIRVDINSLNYWINECRIRNLTDSVSVTFADNTASGSVIELGYNAINVGILLGLNQFYQKVVPELDANYEVSPGRRIQALANLVNLRGNQRLIDLMCGGAQASFLTSQGADKQLIAKVLDDSTAKANSYEEDLLTDKKPLIFRVEPVSSSQ